MTLDGEVPDRGDRDRMRDKDSVKYRPQALQPSVQRAHSTLSENPAASLQPGEEIFREMMPPK